MSADSQHPVAFGPLRLDRRGRSLTRAGVEISLGRRAFDVLCALAAAGGEAVDALFFKNKRSGAIPANTTPPFLDQAVTTIGALDRTQEFFVDILFPSDHRSICVNRDDLAKLVDLADEYLGTSHAIGKDYFRMLYLSVVVITALGLGDIVPLTGYARLGVGFEAFAGVSLAGLFLSAGARKLDRRG